MSFDVNKSDGTLVVTITDGTVSNPGTDLSISIIGRGIDDYAENIAENHLHIMENFANIIEPSAPTRGQLWYDTNIDRLKVHDGSTFDVVVQVERDPTPKLAGNLDVTGFNLVEDGNVILSFASGGEDAVNWVDIIHSTTGLGPIIRSVGSDTNVDLLLQPKGTGRLKFAGLQWPASDGTSNQVVTTDGSGNLTFTTVASGGLVSILDDLTPQLGGNLDVNGFSLVSVTAGDIPITPDTTGQVVLDGLRWPGTDGSPGDILVTDGFGNLSFVVNASSSALQNVVEDTTPQLGGNLDFNNFSVTDGSTLEVLKFAGSPGAVNEITVANAVTTIGPTISATGGDANIDLKLQSKGTGVVNITGNVTVSGTVDGRDVAADGIKLDGIASGATVDQTAVDIRGLGFFDITNDGTGSGLDADLLDGNEATAFATAAQGTTADNALPKAGGTMSGSLTLNGAPTVDLHAATKLYVDTKATGAPLQILYSSTITPVAVSTTTYTATGISGSITPANAANEVLIQIILAVDTALGTETFDARLVRNGSVTIHSTIETFLLGNIPLTFKDSPSTTSSTTYTLEIRRTATGDEVSPVTAQPSNALSSIVLTELVG